MNDIKALRAICRDFILKVREQRRKDKEQGKKKEGTVNLLDALFDFQENPVSDFLTDEEIVDEFFTFFIAGSDSDGPYVLYVDIPSI